MHSRLDTLPASNSLPLKNRWEKAYLQERLVLVSEMVIRNMGGPSPSVAFQNHFSSESCGFLADSFPTFGEGARAKSWTHKIIGLNITAL